MSDIVKRLKNREPDAVRSLYELYGNYVYTIAYSLTSDESVSAEITQDVFLKIWQNIESYDEDKAGLRTWIARIARNKAIDTMRKKDIQSTVNDWELLLNNSTDNSNPELEVLATEEVNIVKGALNLLPQSQREVLMLAYYSGMSQSEIAEETGEPLGTVKSRMRQGLIKLKEIMK